MKFSSLAVLAASAISASAQAATIQSLQFTDVTRSSSLAFDSVAGAALQITPQAPMSGSSTSLQVVVADRDSREGASLPADEAIGVQVLKTLGNGSTMAHDAATLDKNQSLLFTFSKAVNLAEFNMDYGSGMGSRLFSIAVDGGVAQSFKLDGTDWLTLGLTGTTFSFGVLHFNGASYAIDSVGFKALSSTQEGTPGYASPLPEPSVYATVGLSAGIIVLVARRRRRQG